MSEPKAAARIASKWVYFFSAGRAEGNARMKDLLGGKGANLAEMAGLGLPVPPGFTITTEVCTTYYADGRKLPRDVAPQVEDALALVGKETGHVFGDEANPLLVSVRSGSRASMPGMMDTILNLGLNSRTVAGLAKRTGDERFAYDSYRRFIQMYASVVLGIDHGLFEDILDNYKNLNGAASDTDLTADDWREVTALYKQEIERELGKPFPEDTKEQLWGAIAAVFGSWQNARAITYRRLHAIPDNWGTAVNVQAMVFGNMGDTSATGVAFTRNPSTGRKELYGEFLLNAQGEDVVAGIRTPQPLTEAARIESGETTPSLEQLMPETFRRADRDLRHAREPLPRHAGHRVHDRERQSLDAADAHRQTNRRGRHQDRRRPRRVKASSSRTRRCCASIRRALTQLLHPTIDPSAAKDLLTTGLPASPGASSGEIVFSSADAELIKSQGRKVILVRTETSARGYPRHARRGRHPDRARRHDQPRRRRRPRHGRAVRFGSGIASDRCQGGRDARRTAHTQQGRRHHHRRRHGTGFHRHRAHAPAQPLGRLRRPHPVGRRGPPPFRARQRRHAEGCSPSPRVRSSRASAFAAPSTCSSRASAFLPCAR